MDGIYVVAGHNILYDAAEVLPYLGQGGVEVVFFTVVEDPVAVGMKDVLRGKAGSVRLVASPVGVEPGVELHISGMGGFDEEGQGIPAPLQGLPLFAAEIG